MAQGLRQPPSPSDAKDFRARESFDAAIFAQLGARLLGVRTLDVGSIAAGGKQTFTIAVEAARADTNQTVLVGLPSAVSQDLLPWAFVSADQEVTVVLRNPTGGAIDPPSATYTVRVFP